MTRTLRHKFSVQIEIDPVAWDRNYGPEDVGFDSREYLAGALDELITQFIDRSGNRGKVRYVAWEGSGPGIPLSEVAK